MRIDNLPPSSGRIESSKKPAVERPGAGRNNPAKDQVDLSRLSTAVAQAAADQPRIEQLRLEVATEAYRVDPLQIGKKIIDEHLKGQRD